MAPLIDAEAYFTELDSHLRRACAGDTVLIAGFEVDPCIDLQGRSPEHPEYLAPGDHCTVHAKLTLLDDLFATVGSANIFSRSMMGTDSEMSAARATTTTLVRDLRVAVWGDHLRAPMNAELTSALEDLDLAPGLWRTEWLPDGADRMTWRAPGTPGKFSGTPLRVSDLDGGAESAVPGWGDHR